MNRKKKMSSKAKNLQFVREYFVLLQPLSKRPISMINITFPDNSVRQFEAGVTQIGRAHV